MARLGNARVAASAASARRRSCPAGDGRASRPTAYGGERNDRGKQREEEKEEKDERGGEGSGGGLEVARERWMELAARPIRRRRRKSRIREKEEKKEEKKEESEKER